MKSIIVILISMSVACGSSSDPTSLFSDDAGLFDSGNADAPVQWFRPLPVEPEAGCP